MSVKTYGHTHGSCFKVTATEKQVCDFLFRMKLSEVLDSVDISVGHKEVLESGVVFRRTAEGMKLYGHSGVIEEVVLGDFQERELPRDLIDEILFVLDNGLFISWEILDA